MGTEILQTSRADHAEEAAVHVENTVIFSFGRHLQSSSRKHGITTDRFRVSRVLALHEGEVIHVHPGTHHRKAENMLARRERHVLLHLVIVVVVFFAVVLRDRNVAREFLAVERHIKTRRRIRGSHGGKEGVVARFLHVHGVFQPFAFLVVANNVSGRLLVDIDTGTFAVIGFAVIISVIFVVSLIFLAGTRNVKVFGFDLAWKLNSLAAERFTRSLDHVADFAHERHDAVLVRCTRFHSDGHGAILHIHKAFVLCVLRFAGGVHVETFEFRYTRHIHRHGFRIAIVAVHEHHDYGVAIRTLVGRSEHFLFGISRSAHANSSRTHKASKLRKHIAALRNLADFVRRNLELVAKILFHD